MRPLAAVLACWLGWTGQAGAAQTRVWNTWSAFQGGTSYAITVSPTGSAGRACLVLAHQAFYAQDPTSTTASYWSNDPQQGLDWRITKYDPAGVELWTASYNSTASDNDTCSGVGVDAAGNVIAVGEENRPDLGQGLNLRLRRYGAAGGVLSTADYDGGSNNTESALAVTVSPSGGCVVVGTAFDPAQGMNWLVRKYDATGSLLFAKAYDGPGSSDDVAHAVALDPPGGFVVAGAQFAAATNLDWIVQRYDPDGIVTWSRVYDSPGHLDDAAYGVAVSPAGAVAVVGYENRADAGLGRLWRIWLLSPSGVDLTAWSTPGTAGSQDTTARAVAFDASGNLIVVGYEDRPDLGQGHNWFIRKYDAANALLWEAPYNSPGNADDEALSVATDTTGNIVVAGFVTRPDLVQAQNWMVRKYSPAGILLWAREYSSNSINADIARSVAVDAAGNVMVGGTEQRFDLTQVMPLPFAIRDHAVAMVGDRVYVIGGCQQASGGCGAGGLPPYSVSSVWFAPIDPTGDAAGVGKGRIGPWTRAFYNFGDPGPATGPWGPPVHPTPGVPLTRHQAIGVGNRIYVVGGTTQDCNGLPLPGAALTTKRVYSAAVDPVTGQTGPWEDELPLIQNATDHGLVHAAGALYCLGGLMAANLPDQFVQKAEIGPDGHLESGNGMTWESVLALPPGNPDPATCFCVSGGLTCAGCVPCSMPCCLALNDELGWVNFRPFSVMRTIAFLGGDYVPNPMGSPCRYSGGMRWGVLDDCNGITAWQAGLGSAGEPGAGAVACDGSLLSVGGTGLAATFQVLYNPAPLRGLVRTGGADRADVRPADPDGSALFIGIAANDRFPLIAPNAPLVASHGFVYVIGGEMGGVSSGCQRVYRARLASATWWVDAGSWLSPPYDLGTQAKLTRVAWSYSKTGPGADDDWAMVRYRVAGIDGRWTCWTPRTPEEGAAPATSGYYTYASDVAASNPFFRMPLAPDLCRYLQFEVSLYNKDTNDAGAAPTIPRFDEFRISYEPAPSPPPLAGDSCLEVAQGRDGNRVTLRFEVVPEGGDVTAEYYNVAGEIVGRDRFSYLAGGIKAEIIATSRWASGVYVVVLRGASRTGVPGLYRSATRERFKTCKGRLVVRRPGKAGG
ncbi:MAG: hypothetical protein AAB152_07320 [Candidatus Coatesbacteria bacterium]